MTTAQLHSPSVVLPNDILGRDFVDFTAKHPRDDVFSGIAGNIILHELRFELEDLPAHTKAGVLADLRRSAPEDMREPLDGAKDFKHIRDEQLGALLGYHVAAMTGYQERFEAIKPQVDQDFARRVMRAADEGLLHWTAAYGLPNIHDADVSVLDCYASTKSTGESRLHGFVDVAKSSVRLKPYLPTRDLVHAWDHENMHELAASPKGVSLDKQTDYGVGLGFFPLGKGRGGIAHEWVEEAQNELDTQKIGDRDYLPYAAQVMLWTALKVAAAPGLPNIEEKVGEARFGHTNYPGVERVKAKGVVYQTLSTIAQKAGVGVDLTDIELRSRRMSPDGKLNFFSEGADKVAPGISRLSEQQLVQLSLPRRATRPQ